MSEEKQIEDLIKEKMNLIVESLDKKADNAEIQKLKLELEDLRAKATTEQNEKLQKSYDDLNEVIVKQGEEITRLKEHGTSNPEKPSLKSEIVAKKAELKNLAKGNGTQEIELKALLLRSGITNNENAYDLPDIGQLAHRKLALYDIFPKLKIGKGSHNGVIRYYDWDEDTIARAAAAVAEGAAFPESTAKFKKGSITLQKVGDTLPVTEEFFEDEEMFAAELGMFLQTNVAIEIDRQLALGDGTGNTMTGLVSSAGTYTATASGIQTPNIYDLIVKMKEAITTTGGAKYNPDFIVMNIADINEMKLTKDQNDNYILPPFVTRDGQEVSGILVIESNIITENTCVIGDRRYARIYEMPGMTVDKGWANAQFLEDEMTLKVRKRMAFLIRSADAGGFKYCSSISAALTTLATT